MKCAYLESRRCLDRMQRANLGSPHRAAPSLPPVPFPDSKAGTPGWIGRVGGGSRFPGRRGSWVGCEGRASGVNRESKGERGGIAILGELQVEVGTIYAGAQNCG